MFVSRLIAFPFITFFHFQVPFCQESTSVTSKMMDTIQVLRYIYPKHVTRKTSKLSEIHYPHHQDIEDEYIEVDMSGFSSFKIAECAETYIVSQTRNTSTIW